MNLVSYEENHSALYDQTNMPESSTAIFPRFTHLPVELQLEVIANFDYTSSFCFSKTNEYYNYVIRLAQPTTEQKRVLLFIQEGWPEQVSPSRQ